jgi:O-antigen/teichoic acid export membrane protein
VNATLTRYVPGFVRRRLEASRALHLVLRNTGWMMVDKILRAGVGLLVGVWMARYLGPEQYGQFSYAVAFATIFTPVAMLGLDVIVIRRLVEEPDRKDEILGTAFFLMLAGGVTALLLSAGGIWLVRPLDTLAHRLICIIVAGTIFQSFLAIEFWYEAQLQWKFVVYAKNTVFLLINGVKVWLLLRHAPLIAFAWTVFFEVALASAGLLISYRLNGHRLTCWRVTGTLARKLLKDSWPVLCSTLLMMVYLRIDQIMLGDMAGSGELGVYSAAVRLAEAGSFVPLAICSSVFPVIVAAGAENEDALYLRTQKLYNLMAFTAYCIAIPVTLFSGWLVRALYDTPYHKAGPLLAVLIWAGLFTSLGTARTFFMVSKNWTRMNLICMLLGCVCNVALNYLLIPAYGAMGAVVASCVSYWLVVHGTCYFFKPLRRTGWMLTKAMLYPKVW